MQRGKEKQQKVHEFVYLLICILHILNASIINSRNTYPVVADAYFRGLLLSL